MFKNFTPHAVKVLDDNNNIITEVSPEGIQVRISEKIHELPSVEGIPVVKKEYTDIEGLPEPQDNVILIVSILVLQASERSDLR